MVQRVMCSLPNRWRAAFRATTPRGPRPSADRLLQLVEVELGYLGHFGGDHRAAVALVRVTAEVVAVVLLGRIETLERLHLGHDRIVPHVLRCELLDDLLRHRLLLRR